MARKRGRVRGSEEKREVGIREPKTGRVAIGRERAKRVARSESDRPTHPA